MRGRCLGDWNGASPESSASLPRLLAPPATIASPSPSASTIAPPDGNPKPTTLLAPPAAPGADVAPTTDDCAVLADTPEASPATNVASPDESTTGTDELEDCTLTKASAAIVLRKNERLERLPYHLG